ncbi:MAG: hypothetical protein MdMp014T_0026 [Treponematales bacterium]
MSVDLEEVKQILRDNAIGMAKLREIQEKSREEADHQMREVRESHKETEEIVKEVAKARKETDRQLRELKAQVSGVSDNIGSGAEEYFQTALAKSLNFAGVQFDDMTPNLSRTRKGKSCEFDILLVNHDAVALIEAKHRIYMTLPEEMVTKKAAEFRWFFPEYKGYKLYLGAAGFSVDKRAVDEARRLGVGLLKQDGDAVKTVDIPLKAY